MAGPTLSGPVAESPSATAGSVAVAGSTVASSSLVAVASPGAAWRCWISCAGEPLTMREFIAATLFKQKAPMS